MLRRTCRVASGLGRSPLTFAELHGFELLGSRSVPELNLCAYHLRHLGTGAPYYHIDVDDANHTFCMGFRTPSENSKGTAHVLEHTTLCGSKKYPIRDPFFMMLKRSLSNFMNAMTGADYTIYPFSTTNPQDYHNLLDIYLDAVLHPLLREEDFNQEGHRVEVKVENGERRLVSNGVVFQEMRGVVPDPGRHFSRKLMQTMLPTTHYIHESGGYPPEVLKLSYDELVAFHRRHYHPSNSLTITYGSRHPASTMEKLNEYFSSFAATEPVVVPTMCDADRPTAPTTHHFEGPVDVMGDPDRQKRIALSFGISERSNELKDVVELSVLDGLLSSGPISPLYQSLIGSHIGTEYVPMKGYASYLSSPIITYGVAGVDEMRPDAEAEVRTAVESALRHVMKKGFDPRHVESIIFQEELQQRHRAADNGLHFCTSLCSRGLCRAGANPMDFLDWLPHLRQIAANNAACLLPRIEADLLHNPHQALLSVSAKPNFLDKLRRELQDVDDALTRDASEADKDRLEATTAEWLQRVRAPQNVDLLPTLTPADIPRTAFVEPTPRRCAAGEDLYTLAYPTNGLVYVHGLIPFESPATGLALRGLTLPQVPLLTTLLARTGAGPHNYKDLSVQTELACGGFSFAPVLNEDYSRPGTTIAGMAYAFYTTTAKLREALDLLALVLLEPRCSTEDAEVCSRVLARVKQYGADSIQSVQHRGHQVAITRAVSKVSARGALREQWSGLAQTMRASAMMERLQGSEEAATEEVRAILREYAELSVQLAGGLRAGKSWATCEPADVAAVEAELLRFHNRFPALRQEPSPYHMDIATSALCPAPTAAVLRERLPLDTSFVGMAVRLPELTWQSPDQAALRVACQVLSNEFLHRRIREEGGAYGAGCAATLQGEVGGWTMYSYRDPTPDATIAVFGEAAAWVGEQQQQRLVDEAKLRLFSTIDAPYAADSFGESYFLHGVDGALKQRLRDELLAVTPADLKKVAHYLTNSAATACVLEPAAEEKTS